MKVKIVGVILIIYMIPGLYFSSEYGYFTIQTKGKIDGGPVARYLIDVLSASFSGDEARICATVQVDNDQKTVSIKYPLEISGAEQSQTVYKVTSHIYKEVELSTLISNTGCEDQNLQNTFNLIELPASLSSKSGISVQYENLKEKVPKSLYLFKESDKQYLHLVVNLDDPKIEFDDYFLDLGYEQRKGSLLWYAALPFAMLADGLTYPIQYFIYTKVGIA